MAVVYSIDHVLNGIVYRTFTAPVPEVRVATLNTLDRMEIEVVKDVETESGWHIGATAAGRQVGIDLEELTPAVTRMRVVVDQDALLKDSATASEIVTQTADALDQQLALSRR